MDRDKMIIRAHKTTLWESGTGQLLSYNTHTYTYIHSANKLRSSVIYYHSILNTRGGGLYQISSSTHQNILRQPQVHDRQDDQYRAYTYQVYIQLSSAAR